MIARVFPRQTRATPDDPLAFTSEPDMFAQTLGITEVHVSVTFTWDMPRAEQLADAWSAIAPVLIGGPATGMRGEDFTAGMYLKKGYVITSRGCPNHCWFCSVPKREGDIRELPIMQGWNVLDDNLLACSDYHIGAVFKMLSNQKHSIEFTGGLEAARLNDWHVKLLASVKPKQMFFAYDTPDDYEPLRLAVSKLFDAGFTAASHAIRAYVLIGYPRDTFEAAEHRLKQCLNLGVMPMAMLWRNESGERDLQWMRFQKQWARPVLIVNNNRLAKVRVEK